MTEEQEKQMEEIYYEAGCRGITIRELMIEKWHIPGYELNKFELSWFDCFGPMVQWSGR